MYENNNKFDSKHERGHEPHKGHYSGSWVDRGGFISHPYFRRRWGIVQGLPTSFDNAESIYELIAWLQNMMKRLLDDFTALEAELDDFKTALMDLLEKLIPNLIRQFAKSEEFKNIIKDMLRSDEFQDLLEEILRSPRFYNVFKDIFKQLLKDPEIKEALKETIKEIMNDPDMKEWFKEYLKDRFNDPDLKDWIKKYIQDLLKDDFDDIKNMFSQSVQPSFSTLKGKLSSKFEVTNQEHATWGLGYSIQDYKTSTGTKRVINMRPAGSYIKLKDGQQLSDNEIIVEFTYEQLKSIGLTDTLINGFKTNHVLLHDGFVTSNGIRLSGEFKWVQDNIYGLSVGGISYPATWPLKGPLVFSGLDPFKTFIYDI